MATPVLTPVQGANQTETAPIRRFEPRDLMDENGRLLKLLYTIAETAFLLGTSDKTIRRYIERKLLEKSKAMRDIRITRESILTFLKATV